MWPLSVMTEPEPTLDSVELTGTITRTDAPSARTKAGSRPPLAGAAAGALVGLAAATGVGAACPDAGGVGWGGAVGLAAAVGAAAVVGVAAGAGVEVVLTDTG